MALAGNIGNAKIAGLTDQLHMTGNQYNLMLVRHSPEHRLFLSL
jgi:hypothetical protein